MLHVWGGVVVVLIGSILLARCYELSNCKGCCTTYMKKDYNLDFFVYHITRIHKYNDVSETGCPAFET